MMTRDVRDPTYRQRERDARDARQILSPPSARNAFSLARRSSVLCSMGRKWAHSDGSEADGTAAKRIREERLKWGSNKNPSEMALQLLTEIEKPANRKVLFGKRKKEVRYSFPL